MFPTVMYSENINLLFCFIFLSLLLICHRTPLNGILGMSQILSSSPLEVPQAEYVDQIRSSGNSLLLLINDILDFSRIEANAMTIEIAAVQLEDVLDDILSSVHAECSRKRLELFCQIDPTTPVLMYTDPTRIRQVLHNFLSNSVKFTNKGHVQMRVKPSKRSNQLHFIITDTGIGMSDATLIRLFEPFTQADSSMARKFGGTGIPHQKECFDLLIFLRVRASDL